MSAGANLLSPPPGQSRRRGGAAAGANHAAWRRRAIGRRRRCAQQLASAHAAGVQALPGPVALPAAVAVARHRAPVPEVKGQCDDMERTAVMRGDGVALAATALQRIVFTTPSGDPAHETDRKILKSAQQGYQNPLRP
eukprot:COSAG01_NODE_5227_length_4401_cov_2.333333_1_plen_138_part_00